MKYIHCPGNFSHSRNINPNYCLELVSQLHWGSLETRPDWFLQDHFCAGMSQPVVSLCVQIPAVCWQY